MYSVGEVQIPSMLSKMIHVMLVTTVLEMASEEFGQFPKYT
jgi:hypothetical protein